jgi:hypothetical protein
VLGDDSQGSCNWADPYLCFAKETGKFDCLKTPRDYEFLAKCVLEFLQNLNPNIVSVTGRPRRPCNKGSVENVNKLVKRFLGTVLAERSLAGHNPNWTEVLGSVAAAINLQCG